MAVYVLRCDGCGEPFEARRRHARTCSHACRQRVYVRSQERADDELRDRARLARAAILQGADPLGTLALVVWPPETPAEARQLLRSAA